MDPNRQTRINPITPQQQPWQQPQPAQQQYPVQQQPQRGIGPKTRKKIWWAFVVVWAWFTLGGLVQGGVFGLLLPGFVLLVILIWPWALRAVKKDMARARWRE